MREGLGTFDVIRSTDGSSDWCLVGELDLATAGDLNTVVLPWLEEDENTGPIAFDVSELTFIDSTGLRTLYALAGPPHNRKLTLRDPTDAVWQVLAILGFVSADGRRPAEITIRHDGSWEPI